MGKGSDLDAFRTELAAQGALSQYIASTGITLTPTGREFSGMCPFHDDTHPSMMVSPQKQIYKCFSCGAGGDIFDYAMNYHGVPFRTAVDMIADVMNISTPWISRGRGQILEAREALDAAAAYFISHRGEVMEYLHNRGISDESIDSFMLGYAPDSWDRFIRDMVDKGIGLQPMVQAGVIGKKRRSEEYSEDPRDYYARFRHRLMIPLESHTGKIIGFAARSLGKGQTVDEEPKYENTALDSYRGKTLYPKGALLYGLNRARRPIIDADKVYVTEGYLDVIQAHQHGERTVVASGGTAFTKEHMGALGNLTKNVVLVMDGDPAGIKAAKKAGEIVFSAGYSPSIALLPEKKDLDDVLREGQTMQDVQTFDIIDFTLRTNSTDFADTNLSADTKILALNELVDMIALESHVARKMMWMHQVALQTGLDVRVVEQHYRERRRESNRIVQRPQVYAGDQVIHYLTGMLKAAPEVQRAHLIPGLEDAPFMTPELSAIYSHILHSEQEEGQLPLDHVYDLKGQMSMFGLLDSQSIVDLIHDILAQQDLRMSPDLISACARSLHGDLESSRDTIEVLIRRGQRNLLISEMGTAQAQGDVQRVNELGKRLKACLET